MFDIALTVAACLQAGTRADVAWLVEVNGLTVRDWSDAVVITPGGGKIGSLLGGGIDARIAEQAGLLSTGRLIDLEITQVDALIAELPSTGSARCLLVPADTLPGELWKIAAARQPFCVVAELNGDEVADTSVYSKDSIEGADQDVSDFFARGASGSLMSDGRVISVFAAVPQMVVVGGGPIAEALVELAAFVGWRTQIASGKDMATGLIAPLSSQDMVVVAAHDLELAGSGLASALESQPGYIGSVGSRKMQTDRADWLAYRGVTDLSRVHGPAGLDIGAGTPEEVAVAIVAEAIAETRRTRP